MSFYAYVRDLVAPAVAAVTKETRAAVDAYGSLLVRFSPEALTALGTAGGLAVTLVPSTPYNSAALESSCVLKASAGTFRSLLVEIDSSAPTGTYYILLMKGSASVPADGAVTVLRSLEAAHTNGTTSIWSLDEGDAGILFTTGCTACLSTTRDTKTEAGDYGRFAGSVL